MERLERNFTNKKVGRSGDYDTPWPGSRPWTTTRPGRGSRPSWAVQAQAVMLCRWVDPCVCGCWAPSCADALYSQAVFRCDYEAGLGLEPLQTLAAAGLQDLPGQYIHVRLTSGLRAPATTEPVLT